MKADKLLAKARDAVSVRTAFGELVERDGVTVIPAAAVVGGGGGGHGQDDSGEGGDGGGFGVGARPAGAYVIKNGAVSWVPAVDVNRVVLTIGAVVITYLLTRAGVAKARGCVTSGR